MKDGLELALRKRVGRRKALWGYEEEKVIHQQKEGVLRRLSGRGKSEITGKGKLEVIAEVFS